MSGCVYGDADGVGWAVWDGRGFGRCLRGGAGVGDRVINLCVDGHV